MLINYDAEGVAEVMGLSFPRSSTDVSTGLREEGRPYTMDWNGSQGSVDLHKLNAPMVSPVAIENALERGLPRQVLRHLAMRVAGDDKAKATALEWSIVPKTTLERRTIRLSPQESERTERLARLFVHARRALGSEDEARVFVMTPHPELGGRSPVEATRTDLGTRRAEQVLNALEYGLAL